MTVGVIINPVAGGGHVKRAWPGIRTTLEAQLGAFELRETQEPGDAARFAHAFALSACEMVIAVGGDGTISEVADGLLAARAETGAVSELGIIPCGSGSDFARGLGLSHDPGKALARIMSGKGKAIDAGRVSFTGHDGRLGSRHFLNISSLGVSGPTAAAVNEDRRKGRVSAKALFYWRTVVEFLRYRFQSVRISIDNAEPIEGAIGLVAVSNGRYFGGGMMIAPDAELDDALFDVVILRGGGKLKLVWDIRLLYGGRHRNHPAITILRGKRISVEPLGGDLSNAALVEADGEAPGRIPATFEIMPKALIVRL